MHAQEPVRLDERQSPNQDEQKQTNHNDCKLTQQCSQFPQLFLLTAFQPVRMHDIKHREGDIGNSKDYQGSDN